MMPYAREPVTIGVDIGARTLRAVALQPQGSAFRLVAAVETWRTPNHPVPTALDVERLAQALERQGQNARTIVLAAPSDRVASAVVELPPRSSGAPIEILAKAEMAKNIPGESEVSVFDLPPGRRARVSEYLAIALPHASASELLTPFTQSGLTVEAIEPEGSALQRITGSNGRVVLEAGSRGVRIHAFEPGGALFVRSIETQGESVESDRIRTSIVGTIDYLAERFPVLEEASVFVLGGQRQGDRLAELLTREFEASVLREPVATVHAADWLVGLDACRRWPVALGLAMRPAGVGALA